MMRNLYIHVIIILLCCTSYVCALNYDYNNDNLINFLDFAVLANQWSSNQDGISDNNGVTLPDWESLAAFSEQWLTVPVEIIIPAWYHQFEPNDPLLHVSRESVAIQEGDSFTLMEPNMPRVEKVCVVSRPETFFVGTSKPAMAVDPCHGLILCRDEATRQKLYSTTDGVNFTMVACLWWDAGFRDYYISPPNAPNIQSAAVMADGSWLLSLSKQYQGQVLSGRLYRSTDLGRNWQSVLTIETGYVDYFGWNGITGNRVAVGEYGGKAQANHPRRVYLSDDYGATWTKIYDPDPVVDPCQIAAGLGQHVHTVAFSPLDSNQLYVSYGDGNDKQLIKLKEPNDWEFDSGVLWDKVKTVDLMQPTTMFSSGGYLYLGCDGDIAATITRLNPEDDSMKVVLNLPAKATDPSRTYLLPTSSWVFGMCEYQGLLYAAIWDSAGKVQNGIYVSPDGVHWSVAYRMPGTSSPITIVGFTQGYLWGSYDTAGDRSALKIFKMSPVNAALADGIRAEMGITNIVATQASSAFSDSNHGWTFYGDYDPDLSGRVDDGNDLDHNGSLKFVGRFSGGNGCAIVSPPLSQLSGRKPNNGDYIVVTARIKGGPGWPENYLTTLDFSPTGPNASAILTYFPARYDMCQDWQKITMWGRYIWYPTTRDELAIKFTFNDQGKGNFDKAICYIDCVQVIYSPIIQYSGSTFQPGGTQRANESITCELDSSGTNFTSSFEWKPKSSFNEWRQNVPIASWSWQDGKYIDLVWNQLTNNFRIGNDEIGYDSTGVLPTTGLYDWEFGGFVRFAVTSDGVNPTLYIENSRLGVTVLPLQCRPWPIKAPSTLTLGTYHDDSADYGCGLYTNIRYWNWSLSDTETRQNFNTPAQ